MTVCISRQKEFPNMVLKDVIPSSGLPSSMITPSRSVMTIPSRFSTLHMIATQKVELEKLSHSLAVGVYTRAVRIHLGGDIQ